MHIRVLTLAAALLCAGPSFAYAQQAAEAGAINDEEGRGLFVAGRAAYDEGRYADALMYFKRSYEVSQRPALLYNVGQAQDRLRLDAEALESFRQYVALQPDAPNVKEANNRIRALEAILEREKQERAAAAPATPATVAPSEAPAATPNAQTNEPTSVQSAPAAATAPTADKAEDGGLLSKWWFWTATGAVVAGVVVGAIAIGSGEEIEKPRAGNTGISITTLRLP
jgi:tetratricopeptide (TPR) repeat protein